MKVGKRFVLREQVNGAGSDLASRLGSADGGFTEPFVDPAVVVPPVVEDDVFKPSAIWDVVKDVEGFIMPETITAETETELLRPYVAKKFGIETPAAVEAPILHPFAQKVQQLVATKPDASMNDILTELSSEYVDYTKMSADDLIRLDLVDRYGRYDAETNPDGFTDEDIQDSIDGMNKLDKRQRADHIRETYEARKTTAQTEYSTQVAAQQETAYNAYMEDLDKSITDLVAKSNNISDIYGVKLSQTELAEYIKEFKELSIPDKQTGLRKMDTWLSNDQTLFKLFVMDMKQGEDSFRELLTQGREDLKEDIYRRLGLTPPIEGNQGNRLNLQDPATIKHLLSSPDGTVNQ